MTVAPTLSVTIPTGPVILNLNSTNKTFAKSDNLNIVVATNNPTGYELIMSSTGTSLVRDASLDGKNATIETLTDQTGGYTESAFSNCTTANCTNKWGYKNGDSNYLPYTSNIPVSSSSTATSSNVANLSFASKIDNSQPAGSYSIALAFTAVANPLITYIQNLNPAVCTTSPTTVVDRRDEQAYTIQRLADGNCWMMDNLNLGASNLTTDLTSDNTNLVDTILASNFNSWKKTSGTAVYDSPELIPLTGTDPTSGTLYGTLYNYCATSAGTICTNSNTQNAAFDICPAGWRLPSGGPSSEYLALFSDVNYDTGAEAHAPISDGGAAFAFAGYFYQGEPLNQGDFGEYWSSSVPSGDDIKAYRSEISNNYSRATVTESRKAGASIRCIMKDMHSLSNITYLQDVNPDVVNNTTNNATKTLTDIRDENTYTVAKINGRFWMTQNLRFSGTSLNTFTSNVMYTYTESSPLSISWSDLTLGDATDNARYHDSGNINQGYWYNYAGASAMYVKNASASAEAAASICPAGWKLPDSTELTGIVGSKEAFSPVVGGNYYNGGLYNNTWGAYWASNASNNISRYYLFYDGSALSVYNNASRGTGYYVRCISR